VVWVIAGCHRIGFVELQRLLYATRTTICLAEGDARIGDRLLASIVCPDTTVAARSKSQLEDWDDPNGPLLCDDEFIVSLCCNGRLTSQHDLASVSGSKLGNVGGYLDLWRQNGWSRLVHVGLLYRWRAFYSVHGASLLYSQS